MANVKVFWRTDRQTDGQSDYYRAPAYLGGALIIMKSYLQNTASKNFYTDSGFL